MKKVLFTVLILSLLISGVGAQEQKPVIWVMPFSIQGIGEDEARIIEALIQSYIIDLGAMNIDFEAILTTPPQTDEEAGSTPAAGEDPDYILSGSIKVDGDNRVLIIEVVNIKTGEMVNFSSNHKTISDLALKSRALVQQALMSGGAEENAAANEVPEAITGQKLTGRWKGDKGIEVVRLLRDGTGLAVFSSGAQMSLSYTITGDTVEIIQTSPNSDRFYHPVPYGVAKQLVELAEPMKWKFRLFGDGLYLRGTKSATAVEYTGETILNLTYGDEREAEWVKTSR
ncbi:TP0183 family DNA metabolism protein [Breznakiella homolactica]|uniref:Curli production assembly/transport component CsgG n=1 Tax=Breznakiella homolactica TaxID=2798577 RepID=A0A7T7XKP3_9SPIR|nr:hypothetical protein [Breznakiella homolactica]QQO07972.1 hypothetical protein JFL75_13600 [Breznakiella homolactica]